MIYYEVRCPATRKHTISGVEYDSCGMLLGGIGDGCDGYFRCPICGIVHAKVDGEELSLTILGKNKKVDLKRVVRNVDNG